MKKQMQARTGALFWAALLATTACGRGRTPVTAIAGTALGDGPVVGTVTLTDASSPANRRTVQTTSSGGFVVDVSGAVPPYLVKVEGRDASGPRILYGVADGHHPLDVNPITDASYLAAAGASGGARAFEDDRLGDRTQTVQSTIRLLNQLRTVLDPLLQRYGIVNPFTDTAQVRLLLADVRFRVSGQTLTVLNVATGATIYTASLSNLAGGTLTAANMPPGSCTGGGGTGGGGGSDGATLYAASCQSCHGALASSDVSGASAGDIREAIAENEGGMGMLSGLTTTQISAIAAALGGSGGGTEEAAIRESDDDDDDGGEGGGGGTGGSCGTCAYTYGDWGACVDGSQSRQVLTTTPAGCTGTPVLTQTCTTGPPDGAAIYASACASCHQPLASTDLSRSTSAGAISGAISSVGAMRGISLTADQIAAVAGAIGGSTGGGGTPGVCSAYTYGPFGACVNGTQTRTVASASPAGCTDQTTNPPVLAQACTAAIDGMALYVASCAGCHGAIGATTVGLPTSAAAITGAGMAQGLSADQLTAVAQAINTANGR